MAEAKRIRSKNYSEHEKTLLKLIVSNHPVIESKLHTAAIEQKKRSAWTAIGNEFNANEDVTTRTVQQLQVLWKNIKLGLKKENAASRRERFITGGGPPIKDTCDELGDLLSGIIEHQQPLGGIPDNDHLDSEHGELSTNEETNQEPVHNEPEPSTSAMASLGDEAATIQQRPKKITMHEKLAREFHERKIEYLKEEHEMKMRILEVELDMKLGERVMLQKRILHTSSHATQEMTEDYDYNGYEEPPDDLLALTVRPVMETFDMEDRVTVFGGEKLAEVDATLFSGGEDECLGKQYRGPSVDKSKLRRLAHSPKILETSFPFTSLRQMAGATKRSGED
ncbi:uncharacterized protein LOC133974844 [Platichthys flesus]|uniref:uncharacterized protein LOC133974844 n=1 Tax=Platichthys flesus TaxID=8260 RepID=UPI002DBC3974|nr:uncharacterized protein LOC133974844 [Platichthys flesus]